MPAAPTAWMAPADNGTLLRDYYRVLQYGIMVGRFLCWFEAGA